MAKEFEPLDVLKLNLDRIDKYINLANVKAALMLPANGLLLTIIYNRGSEIISTQAGCSWLYEIAISIAILLSIGSFIIAAVVVKAFLKGKFNPLYTKSLLYFGSIREMDLYEFIKLVKGQTHDTFVDDIAGQVHILTKALSTKFLLFNWSLFLLVASFSLLGIVMIAKIFAS